MKNKKAQELSTSTIILIILGIIILVVLILGFTIGWDKIIQSQSPTFKIYENVCKNETIITQQVGAFNCVDNFTWNNSVWIYNHYGYTGDYNNIITPLTCYYKNNNGEVQGFQISFWLDENKSLPTPQQVCQQQEVNSIQFSNECEYIFNNNKLSDIDCIGVGSGLQNGGLTYKTIQIKSTQNKAEQPNSKQSK